MKQVPYEYPTLCIIIIGLLDCPTYLGVKDTALSLAFELASVTLRMRIWADQKHAHLAKEGPGILRCLLMIKEKDKGTERQQPRAPGSIRKRRVYMNLDSSDAILMLCDFRQVTLPF